MTALDLARRSSALTFAGFAQVIINFASAAGHGLYARTLAYGPTKVAVMGITKSFSDFLGPSGSGSLLSSGCSNAEADPHLPQSASTPSLLPLSHRP